MHRKLRAVVRADDLDTAIDRAITGLQNAMDDDVLADGTLTTLVGDYTPLSPSTYFEDGRTQAGFRATSPAGQDDLAEARDHMDEHGNTFIYSIDERDELTASPIPTDDAYDRLVTNVAESKYPYWVVTFDFRYDYDAPPHKPVEHLTRE